jgi:hypothetical protein
MPAGENPDRELLLKLAEAMVEVLGNLFDGRILSDDKEIAALRLEIGYRRQELLGAFDHTNGDN